MGRNWIPPNFWWEYKMMHLLGELFGSCSKSQTQRFRSGPALLFLGGCPRELKSSSVQTHIVQWSQQCHCRHMVETAHMSIHCWMDKCMWYIHTVECYWAIKRNEVLHMLQHGCTLVTVMLSQRSQTHKVMCFLTPLMCSVRSRRVCRDRKHPVEA